MRFSSFDLLLTSLVPLANAFPAAILEAAANDPAILARAAEISKTLAGRQSGADAATALFEPANTFNAATQYINVTKGSGHVSPVLVTKLSIGLSMVVYHCQSTKLLIGLSTFVCHCQSTTRARILYSPTHLPPLSNVSLTS